MGLAGPTTTLTIGSGKRWIAFGSVPSGVVEGTYTIGLVTRVHTAALDFNDYSNLSWMVVNN